MPEYGETLQVSGESLEGTILLRVSKACTLIFALFMGEPASTLHCMRARELFVDNPQRSTKYGSSVVPRSPLVSRGRSFTEVFKSSCVFGYELTSPDLDRTDIRSTLGPVMTCFAAGFLAILLQELGLNLGFVYMSMGVLIGSAVGPASLAILMEKANGIAGHIHSEGEIADRFDVQVKR